MDIWTSFLGLLPSLSRTARVAEHQDRPAGAEISLADPYRLFAPGQHPRLSQYNPSVLLSRRGFRVLDEMRRDDQIKAALSFKKHAVLGPGWEVVSPPDEREDWAPTMFVRDQLTDLPGQLATCLLRVLTALDYGYSVTEIVYSDIREGVWRGHVGLGALKTRKPHEFGFVTDEYGNLMPDGIQQNTPGGLAHYPVEKFVLYQHDMEWSNFYGRSDMESAYRAWWTKTQTYKWLAMFLERLGVPPIFLLYDPNVYKGAQIDDLKTVVKTLQSSTAGTLPRPNKEALDFWVPEVTAQVQRVFLPAFDMFNKDIARALLMPGLLGLTPDQQQGSFARSRVHFDAFMMIVDYLRREVEETIVNEQIVRRLVDLNFSVDRYPIWRLLPLNEQQVEKLLNAWNEAVTTGVVKTTADDERHVRNLLEFPQREDAEDEDFDDDAVEEDEDEDGDDPPEGLIPPAGDGAPPPAEMAAAREINSFERKVDFQAIERDLDRAETGAVAALVALLDADKVRLIARVRRGADPGDVETVVARRPFASKMSDATTAVFRQGRAAVRRELPRKMQQPRPNFVPRDALAHLRKRAFWLANSVDADLTAAAQAILLRAIETGEGVRETVLAIEALFEPYVGDPTKLRDGVPVSPHRTETIVRTNLTDAMNRGRLVEMRDPDIEFFMQSVMYSAIIDSRTTDVCKHLDGLHFRLDDPNLDKLTPPRHFNCRSVLVPVTIDEEVEEAAFATGADVGRGLDLSGKGFGRISTPSARAAAPQVAPTDAIVFKPASTIPDARAFLRSNFGADLLVTPGGRLRSWGSKKTKKQQLAALNEASAELTRLHNADINVGSGVRIIDRDPGGKAGGRASLGPESRRWVSINERLTHTDFGRKWRNSFGQVWAAAIRTSGAESFPRALFRHELGHTWTRGVHLERIEEFGRTRRGLRWFRENVSDYAGANYMEALAETFAHVLGPNYRRGRLPRELEEIIDDMVDKANRQPPVRLAELTEKTLAHPGQPPPVGSRYASDEDSTALEEDWVEDADLEIVEDDEA